MRWGIIDSDREFVWIDYNSKEEALKFLQERFTQDSVPYTIVPHKWEVIDTRTGKFFHSSYIPLNDLKDWLARGHFTDYSIKAVEVGLKDFGSNQSHEAPKEYELDPSDPFEKLLIPMIEMNRKKRADYASDEDIYKNFDGVSIATMGMLTPLEYCTLMITVKQARIYNLRGRDAQNEAVIDSYLDQAIYAVLAYGLVLREAENG